MDIFEARDMVHQMSSLLEEFPDYEVRMAGKSVLFLKKPLAGSGMSYIRWQSFDQKPRGVLAYEKSFAVKRAEDSDATEFISFDEAVYYFRNGEVFPL